MADAYDEVQKRQDQAKAGLLAAMAQDGSAATAAAQADAAAKASQRQEAIRSTLGGMAGRGAPAELQAQIGGQIGSVYDRSGDYAAGSKLSFDRTMGAIGAANANYHDQVRAAAPLARAALERAVARRRAKEQDELSDSELRTRLTGAAAVEAERDAQRLVEAQAARERAAAATQARSNEERAPFAKLPAGLRQFEEGQTNVYQDRQQVLAPLKKVERASEVASTQAAENADRPSIERSRRLGLAAGVDPARLYGLIQPDSPQDVLARRRAEEQLQRGEARGTYLEPEKPRQLTAAEAGAMLGLDDQALSKYTAEPAFNDALVIVDEALKANLSMAKTAELLDAQWRKRYKKSYPELERLVLTMYGSEFDG